jgi:2-polyprenyl-3-methyl-5-hydroxy-6-metoxy-1,4-benzoquinol methylase
VPSSNLALAPTVIHLVHIAEPHRTVLDVGPGRGKYGVLLREYLNEPPEVLDAVEVEPSYVTNRLKAIYDEVFIDDVRNFTNLEFAYYDVVLLVDVIEHLDKDDGLELLRRIPGRVVVCTPEEFFDNGPGLPASEEHRSLWTREDFAAVRTIDVDASALGGIVVSLAPQG